MLASTVREAARRFGNRPVLVADGGWTVSYAELDRSRSLRLLGWLCERLSDRRYDVTRRQVIDGGFLQEHILRGTAPDGRVIAMPACIIATVADGRITRIHEYLDPAGVAALTAGEDPA